MEMTVVVLKVERPLILFCHNSMKCKNGNIFIVLTGPGEPNLLPHDRQLISSVQEDRGSARGGRI